MLSIDARRDLEQLELEFTLADLGVVEKRLEKLHTSGRHGTPAEREANEREQVVLERILPALTEGRPIRDLGLSADDELQDPGVPVPDREAGAGPAQHRRARPRPAPMTWRPSWPPRSRMTGRASCRSRPASRWRSASSTKRKREVFREDLGLEGSSLERVIRASYSLLGLISFFTVGPDETRAWTVAQGATAVDAAAAIHSDLARGFIRAEVIGWQELLELGSMAEARRHGKLRSEGKTYQVQDGDVIEILFNV